MRKKNLLWRQQHQGADPGPLQGLLCGMLSSSVAVVATYPLQLIRVNLQAKAKYKSAGSFVRQVVGRTGIRGLYIGLLPNMMKAVPMISISYAVFETVNGLCR